MSFLLPITSYSSYSTEIFVQADIKLKTTHQNEGLPLFFSNAACSTSGPPLATYCASVSTTSCVSGSSGGKTRGTLHQYPIPTVVPHSIWETAVPHSMGTNHKGPGGSWVKVLSALGSQDSLTQCPLPQHCKSYQDFCGERIWMYFLLNFCVLTERTEVSSPKFQQRVGSFLDWSISLLSDHQKYFHFRTSKKI